MQKQNNNRASILLYVMLLINIALVVGIVVFNNSYVVINNIDIGSNQEEVFTNIFNKGTISLETVEKYNSNGKGFLDGISCPQDITMSGSLSRSTNLGTILVYEKGKVHCSGIYNGNEFRILYDDNVNDFNIAQYQGNVVNIQRTAGTSISLSSTNIALSSSVSSTQAWNGNVASNSIDNNLNTGFDSVNRDRREYLEYTLPGSEKSIGKIAINKLVRNDNKYWNNGTVRFLNSGGSEVFSTTFSGMRNDTYSERDLKYRGLTADVKTIIIEVRRKWLDVIEFEAYELESIGSEEEWEGDTLFGDSDNTRISFSKDGIEGNDGIDDDLNSDNYRVTSIGNIYFPDGYQDDDVVPRTTIFGSIQANTDYQHLYWSNYKTLDVIENNPNNDDTLNVKMGDIDDAVMFINTFNVEEQDYNIKILEFDRAKYRDEYTLFPLNSYEGINLTDYLGYIQKTPDGRLNISKEKTGDEFEFDFQNTDYAIFIGNNSETNLSFHLNAETQDGTDIYINPIDDSGSGTISVLANHIIIGGEKNFIGENFEMIGPK